MAPQNVLILPASTASARASSPSPAARTKLLLEGPVLPTLLRLAAPNVLNLLAFVGVITFDGFFLGRIGTDALAGASLAFPWVMLVLQTTNSGMGAGVSSAVARYSRAAQNLLTLTLPLAEVIAAGRLREIPGVAEALAATIEQLYAGGTTPKLEALRADAPVGVLEMLRIPGLSPQKVRQIHKTRVRFGE